MPFSNASAKKLNPKSRNGTHYKRTQNKIKIIFFQNLSLACPDEKVNTRHWCFGADKERSVI